VKLRRWLARGPAASHLAGGTPSSERRRATITEASDDSPGKARGGKPVFRGATETAERRRTTLCIMITVIVNAIVRSRGDDFMARWSPTGAGRRKGRGLPLLSSRPLQGSRKSLSKTAATREERGRKETRRRRTCLGTTATRITTVRQQTFLESRRARWTVLGSSSDVAETMCRWQHWAGTP
jgi:hypothetical protein